MTTTTKTAYVVQYIPHGSPGSWADLHSYDTEPQAAAGITRNITEWKAQEFLARGMLAGRPKSYRIVKRTITTTEVLSYRDDDGSPLKIQED